MKDPHAQAVARRLHAVKKLLGDATVEDFATRLGVERNAASQWLNAGNLPRVPQMIEMCRQVPGLTLDWIYAGKAEAVPHGLVIRLTAIEEGLPIPSVAPEPADTADSTAVAHPKARRKKASAV